MQNGSTKINLKAVKDKFLFIPIGGCDIIGTNFYLYHYAGHWIAIDFGLGFADKLKTPGVEILLPNLSFIILIISDSLIFSSGLIYLVFPEGGFNSPPSPSKSIDSASPLVSIVYEDKSTLFAILNGNGSLIVGSFLFKK